MGAERRASTAPIMASDDPKEFPDVSQKLSAPKKLSAFEKERLAAEEKRRREQAEAAAALREFEDSFGGDGDDDFDGLPSSARGAPTCPRGSGLGYGGSRGGYGGPPRSGPGSLGPAPGPPPSLKRKRALDELREQQQIRREQEAFANEYMGGSSSRDRSGDRSQDLYEPAEPEDVAPRPTVQLSSLPPRMREGDVMALLEGHLSVHSVSMHPPTGFGKLAVTAVATLTAEASTTQIDAAVSALRDKYLGRGYRLSISRHLSSTALQPGAPQGPIMDSEPFGATKINRDQPGHEGFSMRNAPPPQFAPPDAYGNQSRGPGLPAYANLAVQPPLDMSTIRAIHTLVDSLLSEPDPSHALEIEAELMNRPEVETDERFSFLYDSQSPAGVYYRYLLWSDDDDFETVQMQKRLVKGSERIYEDIIIDWDVSQGDVPFLDLSRLGEALDHPYYESSEEESDDEEGERKFNVSRREGEGPPAENDKKHLSPLKLAKFAWLLSRVPATHARLRMGDVAAISAFAINSAGAGAEEIVDMLVLNIEKPFNSTRCGKFENDDLSQDDEDMYEPDEELPSIEAPPSSDAAVRKEADTDPSQAKLVALYLINDVLHNSATAGVRNAWRYRQLFETAFRKQNTFRHLGQLGKELGWGRMKENQWQNKIRVLFEIWEQGSIFASDVFEALKRDFYEQPVEQPAEVEIKVEQATPVIIKEEVPPKHFARFRRVEGIGSPATSASPAPVSAADVDGAPMDNLDGAPMEDLDGTPMDDIDGTPMELDELPEEKPSTPEAKGGFSLKTSNDTKPAAPDPKRNKQAEDMFADSEED